MKTHAEATDVAPADLAEHDCQPVADKRLYGPILFKDHYSADGLVGNAQAFDDVSADTDKNQRNQRFAVVAAVVQSIGFESVAAHGSPNEPGYKDQTDGIENGLVVPIIVADQNPAGLFAHQWEGEGFFDGDDFGADEQPEKPKEYQGMHHPRFTVLHGFLLTERLCKYRRHPTTDDIQARIGFAFAPGIGVADDAVEQHQYGSHRGEIHRKAAQLLADVPINNTYGFGHG